MSWPQWTPGNQPAVPPVLNPSTPVINSAPAVVPPGLQYTPEQWAQLQQQNWNQWAQWQQQYQQWHQQYGAEYQKSMNALAQAAQVQQSVATLPNVAVPPPLPVETKPPLPTEDPPPPPVPSYVSAPPPGQPGYNTVAPPPPKPTDHRPPVHYPKNNQWQNQNYPYRNEGPQNKRGYDQGADHDSHKRAMLNKPGWQNQPQQPQSAPTPPSQMRQANVEELSEAEKKFDKQFAEWEAQFNKWKEQNVEHPDKEQYREYEKKWETWRAQLLERREQMKRKRLGLTSVSPNLNKSGSASGQTSQAFNSPQPNFNQPPVQHGYNQQQRSQQSPQQGFNQPGQQGFPRGPSKPSQSATFNKPPPILNDEPLKFKESKLVPEVDDNVGSFFKPNTGGGIPGLDLVKDDPPPPQKKDDDVVVIDPEEKKGPDFDAISKGINNILGDKNLLDMLSKVSQNQIPNVSDNLTNSISKIKDHPDGNSQHPSYPEQSNQSFEEHSNHSATFPQREFVNNFDDQTRSSFTHGDQETRFDGGGHFGRNQNQFSDKFPLNHDRFGPGQDRFGPEQDRFASGHDRFAPEQDRFGRNQDRFGLNQDKFGPEQDRFAPKHERFGNNQNRFGPNQDRFGSGPGRGNFQNRFEPSSENRDRTAPGQERFTPNNERFGTNQDKFGPNQDRFVGPNQDRFGFNQDRFGSNNQDRIGSNQDRFGPSQDRVGPNQDRFGPNQDRMGPNQDRFGPNQDRMGPNPDRFGPNQDRVGPNQDRFGPNADRMGPNTDRFGPNQDRMGSNQDRFGSSQDRMGPNQDRFGPNQDRFGPSQERFGSNQDRCAPNQNKFTPNQERYGPNKDRFGAGNDPYGPNQDRFGKPLNDNRFPNRDDRNVGFRGGPGNQFTEKYNQEQYNDYGQENYDDFDYDAVAAKFQDSHPSDQKLKEPSWNEETDYCPKDIEPPMEAPPPPEPDDIFHPTTVIDYDHKPIKPAEPEILVEPLFMFDYRHKALSRIPLPQRPKWLSETVKNIREFDPPTVRPYEPPSMRPYDPPNLRRYPSDNWRNDRYQENWSPHNRRNNYENRPYDERRPYNDKRSYESPYNDWNPPKREEKKSYNEDANSYHEEKKPLFPHSEYEEEKISDTEWPEEDEEMELQTSVNSDFFQKPRDDKQSSSKNAVSIEDLISSPGRYKRPPRIVIILRGPPGSGKTFLAKLIKDKEVENGGSAPRILSLDDYFMIEQEKEVTEEGKKVKVKEMVYEYEAEMEESYRTSLIKSFKKTITDGYFSFIIVDNVNDKVKYFGEMWSFAKQNGFQVYICQLELDVQTCSKRNIHGRSEADIEKCVVNWEPTPSHHPILDATSLLQSASIPEVEMEEVNSPESDLNEIDGSEDQVARSKWDNFDCSVDNLAKLDGVSKPLRHRTMEEFLQLDNDWTPNKPIRPGQKRVRWADLEEQKEQEKMRAIGFVVGHTNWDRMMDPTGGSSALTQTKYIEKIGRYKVDQK